jgi:CDP-paratose 2-epimerase
MSHNYLVTGGAGFIGSNFVSRLLRSGKAVTIFDNLSRKGVDHNLNWLRNSHGENSFKLVVGDVREFQAICEAAKSADIIIHLAAQVAVTTSVTEPRQDFEINALGTFNVLEAARLSGRNPTLLFSSTNKVYGGMEEVAVVKDEYGYRYADLPHGISENHPLDFHSPYGCSKGSGDQYVRDYHRIYGLPTVVFRQSCIYGTRQFGVEDQGWVAWFIIAALSGQPITIYGDGLQVRDVLYVEDLLDAYDLAIANIDRAEGQVYNIGGGSGITLSVWKQFGPLIEELLGHQLPIQWGDWRPGDQKIYVSDIRKIEQELGWIPKTNVKAGITKLFNWVKENPQYFR